MSHLKFHLGGRHIGFQNGRHIQYGKTIVSRTWTDMNMIKLADYTFLRSNNHIIQVQNSYARLGTISDSNIGFQNGRHWQYKNISFLRSRKDIILIQVAKYTFLEPRNQEIQIQNCVDNTKKC